MINMKSSYLALVVGVHGSLESGLLYNEVIQVTARNRMYLMPKNYTGLVMRIRYCEQRLQLQAIY